MWNNEDEAKSLKHYYYNYIFISPENGSNLGNISKHMQTHTLYKCIKNQLPVYYLSTLANSIRQIH